MNTDEKPYLLALSRSEYMALTSIVGSYMGKQDEPQVFINCSVPEGEPPVESGYLFHTLLNLDPRKPETPAEELAHLQEWQRNAIRALFHMGELAALNHEEIKKLREEIAKRDEARSTELRNQEDIDSRQ